MHPGRRIVPNHTSPLKVMGKAIGKVLVVLLGFAEKSAWEKVKQKISYIMVKNGRFTMVET